VGRLPPRQRRELLGGWLGTDEIRDLPNRGAWRLHHTFPFQECPDPGADLLLGALDLPESLV
jgi:hypothetical protein